ncbi:FAD dependent oxidoreductase [Modestobacter sp. DSM 44400]|uniref:FAD-dependent oxidoreductase n=1 Tax=Modestobacter sp. DSM 44400 TaxID=1550230 RepID=UPI000895537B|nr:FAD-dependent oxidoreductase [Modestobacter sp. DSM 44400]SDY58194.1 FAD dependent oxidoreductase [Modestobacter sp. DSM 44400]
MGTTAPHLARPLPFLVPDEAGRDVSALSGLGGRLGDAVRRSVPGGRRSLPGTGRVSASEAARMAPGLRPGRGGVVFWDGQLTDDARLVIALGAAAAFGARVLTGVTVTGVDGPVVQLSVDDGSCAVVRAGAVVNAAGVWAQRLAPGIRLVPSRGSHLVCRPPCSGRRPRR